MTSGTNYLTDRFSRRIGWKNIPPLVSLFYFVEPFISTTSSNMFLTCSLKFHYFVESCMRSCTKNFTLIGNGDKQLRYHFVQTSFPAQPFRIMHSRIFPCYKFVPNTLTSVRFDKIEAAAIILNKKDCSKKRQLIE